MPAKVTVESEFGVVKAGILLFQEDTLLVWHSYLDGFKNPSKWTTVFHFVALIKTWSLLVEGYDFRTLFQHSPRQFSKQDHSNESWMKLYSVHRRSIENPHQSIQQRPHSGYTPKKKLALEVDIEESRILIWFQN